MPQPFDYAAKRLPAGTPADYQFEASTFAGPQPREALANLRIRQPADRAIEGLKRKQVVAAPKRITGLRPAKLPLPKKRHDLAIPNQPHTQIQGRIPYGGKGRI